MGRGTVEKISDCGTLKLCESCREWKLISDFHKNSMGYGTGTYNSCAVCRSDYQYQTVLNRDYDNGVEGVEYCAGEDCDRLFKRRKKSKIVHCRTCKRKLNEH